MSIFWQINSLKHALKRNSKMRSANLWEFRRKWCSGIGKRRRNTAVFSWKIAVYRGVIRGSHPPPPPGIMKSGVFSAIFVRKCVINRSKFWEIINIFTILMSEQINFPENEGFWHPPPRWAPHQEKFLATPLVVYLQKAKTRRGYPIVTLRLNCSSAKKRNKYPAFWSFCELLLWSLQLDPQLLTRPADFCRIVKKKMKWTTKTTKVLKYTEN